MTSNKKNIIVTIDGPAASGKSTTARLVAEKKGWLYLDTGAMYRAMAVKALQQGLSLDDQDGIARMADETTINMKTSNEGARVYVDGVEVTHKIRTPEVDKAVGPVCEVPRVREILVSLQRRIGEKGSLVTEGRDMGTVVFPDADLKYYMIASIHSRAERRQKDLERQGIVMSLQKLSEEIERRDLRDQSRTNSPLKPADDAIQLDTSQMTIDEQVETVLKRIARIEHEKPF
ncbi:(d)CMP kinase [candidate division KSB1 bacterium]|nr:(d)CMP kinase [candidate division KSB1 bacterium]